MPRHISINNNGYVHKVYTGEENQKQEHNTKKKEITTPEDKNSKKIRKRANNKRKIEIDNRILKVEKEIINHKREEKRRKEKIVIENMNKKSKHFS